MAFTKPAKIKKFPGGQGLMETIVAIAILLAVVTAILSLVTNNITGQKESEFQIVANNLAREGIEVARNIRDSNSLAGLSWDAGLFDESAGSQKAIASFMAADRRWQLIFESAAGYDEQLYFSADKIYSHDKYSGPPAPFSRHLNLNDICLSTETGEETIKGAAESCETEEKRIGFKVGAVVGWQENKRTRQVVLEELLYAWK